MNACSIILAGWYHFKANPDDSLNLHYTSLDKQIFQPSFRKDPRPDDTGKTWEDVSKFIAMVTLQTIKQRVMFSQQMGGFISQRTN